MSLGVDLDDRHRLEESAPSPAPGPGPAATSAPEPEEHDPFGKLGLTYDDVLLLPGETDVIPSDVDTTSRLTREISLRMPLVSSAMDTVTESRMAIAMARQGGIGVLHRNLSIEDQAYQVDLVKRTQTGMISNPVTIHPKATLEELDERCGEYRVSGVPVIDEDHTLLGIITNRDLRFVPVAEWGTTLVNDVMTKIPLITAPVGISRDDATTLLRRHKLERLPLVDPHGKLAGLITVKDIQKRLDFPNAARDEQGRLRCAAAVGVGDDVEERVEALVAMDVDAVAIDTAHGHSAGVVKTIERIKGSWPELAVTAGNVVTEEGVEALVRAGADAIKVGVGAGSICTTRIISGAGMPQLSAIHFTAERARQLGIPIIADGGITYSGDIVKAIAAGATTVMLGSLLAGTEESPGETELFEGRRFKSYRGMGSLGAMQGLGADRYATGQSSVAKTSNKLVPEGIEGRVPYAGPLGDTIYQLVGGLRSGMGYAGAADLDQLRTGARFMRVSTAGREESHPHDVTITKEAPNYQRS